MAPRSNLPHRLDRIPFFTPVLASRLRRCWATNLSSGGIALTALAGSPSAVTRGDAIELEFALGETHRAIRVSGQVAWTGRVHHDGRISLGVEFRELSGEDRAAIALFLANHRPRVLVGLASPKEQELVKSCLGHLHVELIDDRLELNASLLRSAASIVLFSAELDALRSFLAALRSEHGQLDFLPLPPAIVCTTIDADRLLPLFNDGQVNEVLRPPLDSRALQTAVDRACERWAVQAELRWASLQLEAVQPATEGPSSGAPPAKISPIVRESEPMQRVYELIRTVAGHDVPVLLLGETGTGKEMAAREIHRLSKRAHTPYVAQDCGALTETLLESELFGHVRGAFTGATTDHPGLFQIADGGTIFLDEIQNTSPGLQAKLMRVVEEGEVRPVGSTKPRRVDVRLIVACNVDLRDAVRERRFRPDFYYRLNRFPIELPPLRAHADDVMPLVAHFLATICPGLGRAPHALDASDPRIERALKGYEWPGNIRELRNVIERSILLTPPGEPLRWETLGEDVRASADQRTASVRALDARVMEYERRLIQAALDKHGGIIRRAARDLDVNAVTLSRKLRRHGLTS